MTVLTSLLRHLPKPSSHDLVIQPRTDHRKLAAILVPIIATAAAEPFILLTQRRHDLSAHPGQFSFPGGGVDTHDRDLLATALRETEEEVGLLTSQIKICGIFPARATLTSYYWVTPFVGIVEKDYQITVATDEVANIIEVPLAHLLHRDHFHHYSARIEGQIHTSCTLDFGQHHIWGFTATILYEISQLL